MVKKLRIPASDLRAAVTLYESFREKKPRRIKVVTIDIPKVVACIGYVEAIDYKTTHGDTTQPYRHEFAKGSRPLLCVSADGKSLHLLGGRYRFTERGIVDRNASGQEIENKKHGRKI